MVEIKKCTNCRFRAADYKEEPCYSCQCCSKWEPEVKEKDRFKTGDVIVHKNDTCMKIIYIYLRNNWALRVPNYVLVRSECDYYFSNYTDKLIADDVATWIDIDNFEFASSTDITEHDDRANRLYYADTLNAWFSGLIRKESKKINVTFACPRRTTTNPKTVYKYQPKALVTSRFIKDVIFSDPATIIFWNDGTKTVVKTQDGEKYDKEKGFAMAVCKKVFGNERDYYHVFKRWMRKGKVAPNYEAKEKKC